MCGITGFVARGGGLDGNTLDQTVRSMASTISHRGPDGHGVFVDEACGLAFGHRRLAIVDLTEAGAQPIASRDGRWILNYNGEIYNYREIRDQLEQEGGPTSWRGHCDSEVLVEAIAAWGIERTLIRGNGMFAFAVWDRRERTLHLARDRMGEKPLYYGWQSDVFLFGSELKSLIAHPKFTREIDPASVSEFLIYGYVPTPLSIFKGIKKLPPGCVIALRSSDAVGSAPVPKRYWNLPLPAPTPQSDSDALAKLDDLLRDSVRLRMQADVPMGAFLSGGIDSSSIVSLMQSCATSPIRTFSIGFEEEAFDEAKFAAGVARHLGTDHTELKVTEIDALSVVPELPKLYDEPFADSSQVPTYLLAKLTRHYVTVSMSGDGGDELFCGYARYFAFDAIWKRLSLLTGPGRRFLGATIAKAPDSLWRTLPRLLPTRLLREMNPPRARKMAAVLSSSGAQEFYRHIVRQWSAGELMPETFHSTEIFFNQFDIVRHFCHPVLGMSFVDMGSYLPDDILVKVDRATMAASLEGRIPFLDHRIVEFAAKLPIDQKIRGAIGKRLLRRLLNRYVPDRLIDRPKMGFGIPIEAWLRSKLKPWAEDLLFGVPTVIDELIDMKAVRDIWLEHKSGRSDQHYRLWTVLMLIAWARHWKPVLSLQ